MRIKILILVFFLISSESLVNGFSAKFELVDRWTHKDVFIGGGYVLGSLIKSKDEVIILFQIHRGKVVLKDKVTDLFVSGEGPGEVQLASTIFQEEDEVVVIDGFGKLNFLKNEDQGYKVKRTQYLKSFNDGRTMSPRRVIKFKGKYYVGSWSYPDPDRFLSDGYYVNIFDPQKKMRKSILKRKYDRDYRGVIYLFPQLVTYGEKLLVVLDYELKVNEIDPVKDEVIREIDLEKPAFFKKPVNLWRYIAGQFSPRKFQEWRLSYHRVTALEVAGEKLVLQVRTCSEESERFALLFYRLSDYQLEEVVMGNDLLLGYRDGFYYFLEGGDPGDDDVEELKILLYRKIK